MHRYEINRNGSEKMWCMHTNIRLHARAASAHDANSNLKTPNFSALEILWNKTTNNNDNKIPFVMFSFV